MPAVMLQGAHENPLKTVARAAIGAVAKRAWPLVPRSVYLEAVPTSLNIALTRKCNANCVFCAYQFASKQDRQHMPEDLFDRLIEEIEKLPIRTVMLSPNIGEPTIAPRFLEKIARLRAAGVETIEMTSNAVYWHRIGIKELLADGPDKINISFAGFDREMYERDYRIHHYEQTRDNILGLIRENACSAEPKSVQLWLRGDLPLDTLVEAPEVKEVMALGVPVQAMTEVDDWFGLIKAEALPSGYKLAERAPIERRPCALLFDLTIHPDGDLHLCSCRNVSGDPGLHIGNFQSLSLTEALARIPTVLSAWERGDMPASCQTCSMYNDPAPQLPGRLRQIAKDAALGVRSR